MSFQLKEVIILLVYLFSYLCWSVSVATSLWQCVLCYRQHAPPLSHPRLLLTSECRTTEFCTVRILNFCCVLQDNISVTKIGLVYVILQNSVPERQLCVVLSDAVCLLRVAVRNTVRALEGSHGRSTAWIPVVVTRLLFKILYSTHTLSLCPLYRWQNKQRNLSLGSINRQII